MEDGKGGKNKKSHELSEDAREAFEQAMKGVKPLKKTSQRDFVDAKRNKHHYTNSTMKLRRENANIFEEKDNNLLQDMKAQLIPPEEFISYRCESLSLMLFNSLKNGKIPVEYNLDLHGHTVDGARDILMRFIHFSQKNRYRCLRIIHGKSHKKYQQDELTLKSMIACWLQQIPDVLSYCSCLPRDGGTGAIYVLLRKQKV